MSNNEREIGTEATADAWAGAVIHNLTGEGQIVRDFDCPVENEDRLRREVNRLARKAAKLGYRPPELFMCGIDHIVTREVEVPGGDGEPPTRARRKVRVVRCVVAGPELRANGYEIIAAVDWLAGKPVVRKFPGHEGDVTPGMTGYLSDRGPYCTHCHQTRARNTTYILKGTDPGFEQVGSTCLLDFCGIDPTYAAQVAALYEAQGYAENLTRYEADLDEFLSWCAVAVRLNGRFVSRKAAEAEQERVYQATGKTVSVPTTKDDAYAYQRLAYGPVQYRVAGGEVTDADRAAVEAVKGYVRTLDPDQSDYERNLRSIFDSGILLPRHAGIAASAFGGYLREVQRVAEAALRAATTRPSEYLGEQGQRITVKVQVVACHISEGAYGTTWIYRLRTPEGDRATWFSSNDALNVGEEVTLVGTIKKTEEYRGEKGTVLTRCRVL
jgi:hypothetical protein